MTYLRAFVIILHKARTDSDFKLEDLPGSGGRMDILCRFLVASLLTSHGIRRDTIAYAVLLGPPKPPVAIKVLGDKVKYLNPDERSTGALIRNALIKMEKYNSEGTSWKKASPGIFFKKANITDILEELKREGFNIYYLKEDGKDIRSTDITLPSAFVLSDHVDLTQEEEKDVMKYSHEVLSLGPISLYSEHCVVIIHNELDRRSYFS
ncbi:MAG: tRNA (pseudouridine(54)-N(1))-methyltransferase TrmY [Euryarchaeota archaeon]|nr:tRNA (pseudouridine(54)-N(1))-methyltransferase TrmY [Euryarchaeota archaeon]